MIYFLSINVSLSWLIVSAPVTLTLTTGRDAEGLNHRYLVTSADIPTKIIP